MPFLNLPLESKEEVEALQALLSADWFALVAKEHRTLLVGLEVYLSERMKESNNA